MLSTLHARENDPHDALEIAPDVVFSARADRPSPTLAPDALGPAADRQSHIGSSAAAPSLDATFRATAADNRHVLREPSQARAWARRALIGFLFAIGSAFAATGWQHYGDRATSVIADWMPPFALTSPAPANPPESASPPVLQAAVVTEVSSQATSSAPDAAAMPSSVSDQTQLIQSMARDVATMGQQIEQLKASIAELKAGQEQMSREMTKTTEARASESSLRPRPSPPPLRPAATAPTRKPRPTFSAAQATPSPLPSPQAALPPAPLQTAPAPQATTQPDGEPVVRPPMPLR